MTLRRLLRASVLLVVGASVWCCTDPRSRIAAPTVKLQVSQTLKVTSPGTIPLSIYAYDPQGLDRVLVNVRSGYATLDGDSTLVFTEQYEQTLNLVWLVPDRIPVGTQITLAAKARNVIGFDGSDTLVLPVQQ